MPPTFNERQDLADASPTILPACVGASKLRADQLNNDDIVYAWADYSDGLCAG